VETCPLKQSVFVCEGESDAEAKLSWFRDLLSQLPDINYCTLRCIITHLTQSVLNTIIIIYIYIYICIYIYTFINAGITNRFQSHYRVCRTSFGIADPLPVRLSQTTGAAQVRTQIAYLHVFHDRG